MNLHILPKILATRVIPDGNLNLTGYTCLENKKKWSLKPSENVRYVDDTEKIIGTTETWRWESIKQVTIPEYYLDSVITVKCDFKGLADSRTIGLYINGVELDSGLRKYTTTDYKTYTFEDIPVKGGDVVSLPGVANAEYQAAGKNLKILAEDTEIPGLVPYNAEWVKNFEILAEDIEIPGLVLAEDIEIPGLVPEDTEIPGIVPEDTDNAEWL